MDWLYNKRRIYIMTIRAALPEFWHIFRKGTILFFLPFISAVSWVAKLSPEPHTDKWAHVCCLLAYGALSIHPYMALQSCLGPGLSLKTPSSILVCLLLVFSILYSYNLWRVLLDDVLSACYWFSVAPCRLVYVYWLFKQSAVSILSLSL